MLTPLLDREASCVVRPDRYVIGREDPLRLTARTAALLGH